jgi:hypothetical protein
MVGLINLATGLSAMGKAVSDTAHDADINAMDQQKLVLADQLAGARETNLEGVKAGYAATAASNLADVNTKAAQVQNDFQTNLENLQEGSREKIANISAGATLGAANIEAGASTANVKAQLAQKDIQVSSDGTMQAIDRTTGEASPVTGDDGKPIKSVVPGAAALVRDMVNSTNEQMRALTYQYKSDLKGPQDNLTKLRSQGLSDSDPEVISAQKDVDTIRNQYAPAFANLNKNMDTAAASMRVISGLDQNQPGGKAPDNSAPPPAKNRPPLGSFLKNAPGGPGQ